jgi:hypothetical protein
MDSTLDRKPGQSKPMHIDIYSDERALAHAIALIESNNVPSAIGDKTHPDGPAIGAFQIHQSAWMDISDMRAKQLLPIHPYHDAFKPHVAREYAITFLRALVASFRKHHGAPPSPQLLYACYSLGPSIIAKVPNMQGIRKTFDDYSSSLITYDRSITKPLTSVGYTRTMATRKMATGERYQNLVHAHHDSLRQLGIPLLWL